MVTLSTNYHHKNNWILKEFQSSSDQSQYRMRLNNKGIESSRGFEQPSPEKIDDSENVSFAVDSQGYPCKDNSTTLNRFRVPKL